MQNRPERRALLSGRGAQALALLFTLSVIAAISWSSAHRPGKPAIQRESSDKAPREARLYRLSETEWASLKIQPVEMKEFSADYVTEGKISINEDRSTPIFSPHSGRLSRLLVRVGETIERGQLLFVLESPEMVQAQNDFLAAAAATNKARAALNFARITDKRNRDLYEAKAVALKDVQQAQAALAAAQNDMRSAETAYEGARNRLRILGCADDEIATLLESGKVNAEIPIYAPIGGTVVQRKVGPGQYVNAGASDPVLLIGDLSSVWLTAFVREVDAPRAGLGQDVRFVVHAYPDRVFRTKIEYVASAIDTGSRRLLVRATVDNSEGLLKPEMLAAVTINTKDTSLAVAVPRDALVYEGASVRAWVARDDRTIELRDVVTGTANGRLIEIVDGLAASDRIVVKGNLLVDRFAAGS